MPDDARSAFDATLAQRLPLRILLAEDHPTNQQLVLRFLRRMGYAADVAANGVEALNAVRGRAYDVVLMDVEMPEMDGIEAARRLNAEPGPRPYIIAMTANVMEGDRDRCIAAGMDDYVGKPIRIAALQSALAAAHARRIASPTNGAGPPAVGKTNGVAAAAPAAVIELDGAPIIDPQAFDELREFLQEEADEVISGLRDAFLQRAPELADAIRQAIAQRDGRALHMAAHTSKGLSGTIGARRIETLCAALDPGNAGAPVVDASTLAHHLDAEIGTAGATLRAAG